MSAKDIFGLIVRLVGLALVLWGLFDFLSWTLIAVSGYSGAKFTGTQYLIYGAVVLIVGLFLMRKAHLLVNFAYGKRPQADSRPDDPSAKKSLKLY